MRRFTKLFLLLLFSFNCMAQSTLIKGKVSDTLEKKSLANAVVALTRQSDSTLFKFSRSNANGEFSIENVMPGKYQLLISFPKFADYADNIEIKDQAVLDLGTVPLTGKAKLLEEVIVRGGQAIKIKGDTTEFNADSFKVKDGATVEDLLKEFPGFQVDSKGQITVQGRQVGKVLVDGEEFFGDDPTMATQNISAKAVDKVQVFDTKTDQQQLTGISTGNESKTVNIKLKESAKKGAFGKIHAASDFDRYFDGKALYNKFVGKKKVSVYGTKTNLNTGSLTYEDRNKLGMEEDLEYDEINGYYYSMGNSDEFNDWSLRGLPEAYTAGGLFSNKWNSDKHNVNGSYRFNRLATNNINSTRSQTILPNGSLFNNNLTKSNGLNQQHALNGKYEWKVDSFASFKFVTAGIYKTTDTYNDTYSESLNEKLDTINKRSQTRDNHTERKQIDNQLTYKQLFKKKNRQLLWTLRHGYTEDDQQGMLNSIITNYKFAPPKDSITDQFKIGDGNSTTLGSKITFSEPLSLKWNLVTDYSFNNNNSSSHLNSFNKGNNGKYETLDSVFSNNFDFEATSNSGNLTMRYMGTKTRFAFGSGVSSVNLKLHNLDNGVKNRYNFLNLTPQATFSYTFKAQTAVSFSYRGTTRQPSINQLQPIRNNEDPLNVFVGNPDLKVGFNHSVNASFNSYKVLSSRYFYVSGYYSAIENAIANSSTIDITTGKRTYTPINVNGNYNWSTSIQWSRGQGEKKFRHNAYSYVNGGRNVVIINGNRGYNNYTTYQTNYNTSYNVTDKYNFYLGPQISYNKSKSSLQTSIDNNYFTYGGRAGGYVMLPGKIEVSTDVNAQLRQKVGVLTQNTDIIMWNANISRKVFKDKSGKVFLVANDILDQNKGWNRSINGETITDSRFLSVSRYFLLKFEWTFNKMPK